MRLIHIRSVCLLFACLYHLAQGQGLQMGPQEVLRHRIQKIKSSTYRISRDGEQHLTAQAAYRYDVQGHLTGKETHDLTSGETFTLESDYDLNDHRSFRRLSGERGTSEVSWTLTYDDSQRLVAEQDNNIGLLRQYRYDDASRVRAISTSYDADSDPFSVEYFAYDADGRMTQHQHRSELMVETTSYQHDARGRLTQIAKSTQFRVEGEADQRITEQYTYDTRGNMIQLLRRNHGSRRHVRIKMTYDEHGRIISRQSGKHRLVYVRDAETGLIREQHRFYNGRLILKHLYEYELWDRIPFAGR